LGLSVLVGSAIRTRSIPWATAIAAGGFSLVVGIAFTAAESAATTLGVAGWLAALATGLGLRLLDTHRHAAADQVRRDERLELARELHDVVAHHITGIVIHTQAAQLVAHKHPDKPDSTLADIEAAASDALTAMRRVVGLLRDTDDAAPPRPDPNNSATWSNASTALRCTSDFLTANQRGRPK
jgi:signal transduction histidine kinase